jgi:uncharacterized protein with FMN-binding domain
MKTFLIILGSVVLVVILAIGGFALYMGNGLKSSETLKIGAASAEGLADGAYEGEYSAGRFSNKVSVTVQGGRIAAIDVIKTVAFERPEVTKALLDSVIAGQSTDVDVQTGATATGNAYLKSIENALESK